MFPLRDGLVAVVASVGEHSAFVHFDVLQQRNRVTDVTELSLADYEVHRITVGVYYRMDLGGSTFSAVCPISLETPFFCTRAVLMPLNDRSVYG